MDLDSYIITVFCLVDDSLKELMQGRRLRQRGPDPTMTDSEVLTIQPPLEVRITGFGVPSAPVVRIL